MDCARWNRGQRAAFHRLGCVNERGGVAVFPQRVAAGQPSAGTSQIRSLCAHAGYCGAWVGWRILRSPPSWRARDGWYVHGGAAVIADARPTGILSHATLRSVLPQDGTFDLAPVARKAAQIQRALRSGRRGQWTTGQKEKAGQGPAFPGHRASRRDARGRSQPFGCSIVTSPFSISTSYL